jgi:hypothetical protein
MFLPEREQTELAEREAEARTLVLIDEFEGHFTECIEVHPEIAERKREVFEARSIQKIAGLHSVSSI